MFANDITLTGPNSATRTYSSRGTSDGKTIRADASAGMILPKTLTISHSEVKRKGYTASRHLVRLDEQIGADAPTGVGDVVTVYVVVEVPQLPERGGVAYDQMIQLKSFLTDTNWAKLLNGEP